MFSQAGFECSCKTQEYIACNSAHESNENMVISYLAGNI